MKAGALREVVDIEAVAGTADGGGGFLTDAWATITGGNDIRAAIVPVSASERLRAGQLGSDITHRVTLRYFAGVTTAHRVKWGTRILLIRTVINVGELNRELLLDCTEQA